MKTITIVRKGADPSMSPVPNSCCMAFLVPLRL